MSVLNFELLIYERVKLWRTALANKLCSSCSSDIHFERSMTIPQWIQPNLPNVFGTQISISSQLFNLVLNTAKTREELERAWEALAQQEEISDQIRNVRQQNYLPFLGFVFPKYYGKFPFMDMYYGNV